MTGGGSGDCWRVRLRVVQVTGGGSVELETDQVNWRQVR